MGTYHVNVKQSGSHATSVVGDNAQVVANFGPAFSVDDLLKLLKEIKTEIDHMDIPEETKEEAKTEVDRAIVQANKDQPDKSKLVENLKSVTEIIKKSTSIALGVAKFWTLIRKAIEWATG
jgi:hypothetical protein